MNSSVIVFPGSNCDRDIAVALEKLKFKNKMVWHKDSEIPKSDLIVLPGGFSYGDYLRSGAIAAKSKNQEEAFAKRKAATDKELEAKRNKNKSKRQKAKDRKRLRREREKEAKKKQKVDNINLNKNL